MAATLQAQARSPSLGATPQMCTSVASPKASDMKNSLDKENGVMLHENSLHREILEKLKHESAAGGIHDPQLLSEQLVANYHKQLTNSPMSAAAHHAAELFRREALLSLQSGIRPNLDYFNLAAFQEQQMLANAAQRNSHSPVRNSHSPSGSSDDGAESMSPNHAPSTGGQWTYEEQFKQLYELGDEPDRREFLDELFAFMQKRGTPVNRIPIMAKQTLDMYKLFKLVVGKGGLVEVINKKLWREITKGLNLPSSITSAAFTLRTQYMKYIYPYECEKYDFSKASELQAAIDGNRREGRRPGYGYDMASPGTMPPFYNPQNFPAANPFFSPALMNGPMANLISNQLNGYMHGNGLGAPLTHPRIPTSLASNSTSQDLDERSQSPIDVSSPLTSANQSAFSRPHPVNSSYNGSSTLPKRQRRMSSEGGDRMNTEDAPNLICQGVGKSAAPSHLSANDATAATPAHQNPNVLESLTSKAEFHTSPSYTKPVMSPPIQRISSTSIKIVNNKDTDADDTNDKTSVAVTMEVNGVLYQGVLFAQK